LSSVRRCNLLRIGYRIFAIRKGEVFMKLEGAVVVVTGASKGIGHAIAEEMGHNGAKVVVNYSQTHGPAEELVAKLRQSDCEAVAIQADVSKAAQAAR
jgi:NAD(P)-dependent dehydrogenase (short-subunit alcohol dehydrogenase family)